ncbi:MAG: PHP domain-containing protein [Lachnospiraceae bacterium]|nr:PHP domain-containing protein [Lachnospiraceae bacterium]
MNTIDLHVHSTCSDGTFTPAQLVEYARQKGLRAFALTDHDTISGLAEAFLAAGNDSGTSVSSLEVIAGIEFSTEYLGRDVHIVGLDMDYQTPAFLAEMTRRQEERVRRNQKIFAKMAADGIAISEEQMRAEFGDTIWTRAHIARYLAEHGYVPSMQDAFLTHVGDHCKYFVPREKSSPEQTAAFIRQNHGIPVLAHPFQYRLGEDGLNTLVHSLKSSGLIGIEAIYSCHSQEQERYIRQLCRRLGLCISGGSDFHGTNKPDIDLGTGMGGLQVPYEVLEKLRNARQR